MGANAALHPTKNELRVVALTKRSGGGNFAQVFTCATGRVEAARAPTPTQEKGARAPLRVISNQAPHPTFPPAQLMRLPTLLVLNSKALKDN